MSILVTGGAGFIGSHLLDRLAAQGRQTVCLENFDTSYPPAVKRRNIADALATGLVEVVEGDVCEPELCARVFEDYEVDKIVHLAARAGVRPSIEQPLLYERVNCAGTINLLECARKAGARLFLFGSSSSVYGVSDKVPFSEEDCAAQPISPYAVTKRAGELLCHTYHHLYGLPVICLRLFTVYGPRQRPDLAIMKFAQLIEQGQAIQMFGDGSSRRDYTYIDDIVDGILAALASGIEFETINLGSSNPVSLRNLIALLEKALGKKAHIEQVPDQPGDVPLTYADISKAQRLLGYGPRTTIEKGIREFVEWLRGGKN